MNTIAILTATYNHPDNLKKLYLSLCRQSDKNFTWVIVNDGSEKETEKVLCEIDSANQIDTYIINRKNGGKSSAVNDGLDCLTSEVVFVVIVDDDEVLFTNAVSTINRYIIKYNHTKCGVIHFNRQNERGKVIASPEINQDFYKSYQKFKSEGRHADGYIGYFAGKLGNNRFSIYKGEKYIAPSTLFMKVTDNCKMLWAEAVLGQTEYLAGGITRQGRKLRVNNPRGMVEYCEDMQRNGASLKIRIVYSVQGYAYSSFCKEKYRRGAFVGITAIAGKILGIIWKRKYLHKNLD